MDKDFILTLKGLVNIDIQDENLKEQLIENLNEDLNKGVFNLEKYQNFYNSFGPLGKTQLDIWKSDKTLKKNYKEIGVILAISKFKNSIKKLSS